MRSPRAVAYSILIYSFVSCNDCHVFSIKNLTSPKVLGIVLIVLATMSLMAYGCSFNFKTSQVTYMMFLIYYRTARCYDGVHWPALTGNNNLFPQPTMPSESDAVFRTLMFSVGYLVLSIFLVIVSVLALGESLRDNNSLGNY